MDDTTRRANVPVLRRIAHDAVVSGAWASVLSSLALIAFGRRELRDGAAPLNGPSQWIWGPGAAYVRGFGARHTVVGYGIHHLASVFWAFFYEALRPRRSDRLGVGGEVAACAATSAVAALVDFELTPPRLRPGFEKRLSRVALVAVYGAFGVGLFLAHCGVAALARSRRSR